MNISQEGINFIKQWEGLYLNAYNDGAGVCTIGYGHTGSDVYYGQTITEQQAEQLLRNDLQGAVNDVNRIINNGHLQFIPTQSQFDTLVSFTFNCGNGSLNTLTKNRNMQQVADALLLYKLDCNGDFMQGLYNRRVAERIQFLNGETTPFTDQDNSISEYEEHGNAEVLCDCLNVRTSPTLSGEVVAHYYKGEVIYNYDRVYNADGYRWVRYLGGSGEYRYVAVRDLSDMHKLCNCY